MLPYTTKKPHRFLTCCAAMSIAMAMVGAVHCTMAQTAPLSAAYYPGLSIPSAFLERVRDAGFTHVIVPIYIVGSEWGVGTGNEGQYTAGNSAGSQRELLEQAIQQAINYDLTIIPLLPSANIHAHEWANVKNPNLTFQPKFTLNTEKILHDAFDADVAEEVVNALLRPLLIPILGGFAGTATMEIEWEGSQKISSVSHCPTYAPIPDASGNDVGFAVSFRSLLTDVVLAAYQYLGLPNPAFIHLGMDEPMYYDADVEPEDKIMFGKSQEDLKWMFDRNSSHHFGVAEISLFALAQEYHVEYQYERVSNPQLPDLDLAYWEDYVEDVYMDKYVEIGTSDKKLGFFGTSAQDGFYYYVDDATRYREGLRELFADFLARRIQDIKDVMLGTEALMWADMLDPEKHGGDLGVSGALTVLAGKSVNVGGSVEPIQNHLLLMPWHYPNTYTAPLWAQVTDGEFKTSELAINTGKLTLAWLACGLLPPISKRICQAIATKYVVESFLATELATFNIDVVSRGKRYDAENAIAYFITNGFRFVPTASFQGGQAYGSTLIQAYKWSKAVNQLSPQARFAFFAGYASATWDGAGSPNGWDTIKDRYDQAIAFDVHEVMASSFRHQTGGMNTSSLYGNLVVSPLGNGAMIDAAPVRKVDYLTVGQTVFDPDLHQVVEFKSNVSYYDALLYCNLLSLREGLQTVYSFDITYNSSIDAGQPVILSLSGFSEDLSQDGYRLPHHSELSGIVGDPSFVMVAGGREWATGWSANNFPVVNSSGTLSYETQPDAQNDIYFRVVRNIPNTTTAVGISVTGQSSVVARNLVTISGGTVSTGGNLVATSGRTVRILPEFSTAPGAYLRVHIDAGIH